MSLDYNNRLTYYMGQIFLLCLYIKLTWQRINLKPYLKGKLLTTLKGQRTMLLRKASFIYDVKQTGN